MKYNNEESINELTCEKVYQQFKIEFKDDEIFFKEKELKMTLTKMMAHTFNSGWL